MLRGARERYVEIAEGNLGSRQTLARMRTLIRTDDPVVDAAATAFGHANIVTVFEWVRAHMLYTPDYNNGIIVEEIKTPGYLLAEIATFGRALGDCDDYVVLLGALYVRRRHRVVLVAVARAMDRLLDHVYLTVDGIAADGIVSDPFGWAVPASEVTHRETLPL